MEPEATVVVSQGRAAWRSLPCEATELCLALLIVAGLGGCAASPAFELGRLTGSALSAVRSCDDALLHFAEGELPDTATETLLGDMTRSLRATEQSIAELAGAPKSERREARAATRLGGDACASARASLKSGTINSRIDTTRSTLALVDARLVGLADELAVRE